MGPPRPRPSSPTTLFRQQIIAQLGSQQQQQQQQRQPLDPSAVLLMPLSATTGALRPPPLPPAAGGGNIASPSLLAPPVRASGRSLRSRPTDVDELGRMPGTVDVPGAAASSSKRRRVQAPPSGPSRRRFIPPPTLPRPGEDPDEDAEPASEYNCPVCLCPPTQAVVTPCGHLLCFACLQKSLAANLIRLQQKPNPLLAQNATTTGRTPPLNLDGDCPVCRVALPGGLFGRFDRRTGKIVGEGVRRIEVKLVDVRPVGPPIELE